MNKSTFLKRSALVMLLQAAFAVSAAPSGIDKQHFDATVRVQDDLFGAVNGHWLKTVELPADKGVHGAFIELRDLSDQRVRSLLDSLLAGQPAAGSKEEKIARYYQAFLDTEAIDKAGLAPVQPLLAAIDAIGNAKQLSAWFGAVQGQQATPIQLNVGADFKQPTVNRTVASQGGLGLPGRDYYLKRDDARMAKAREAYVRYLTTLATTLGEADPAAAAQRVLALETKIAAAHWDPVRLREPTKTYNPMTPAQLTKAAPGLDWQGLLAAANLAKIDRLIVGQPSTAREVARLVAREPLADWKLYAKLHTLDAHAGVLPKALREARFELRGVALSGASAERPRWQQGVEQVNAALGEALGELYVAQYFPAAHKAKMDQLVGNLLAAFGESVDSLSWMSAPTKKAAHEKLGKIMVKIGYPEIWRDFSALDVRTGDALGNRLRSQRFEWQYLAAKAGQPVDRREWGMLPQQVNAYYEPTTNEIVFPAAILQPPFFNAEADDAVNYGGIGGVIGHEISHGFDDEGSQFDADGKLRNWWSKADRKAFDAVTAKLVAQYNGYEPIPGKHVNGQLTLGENIADLSGLQVAFKAYRRSLGGKPAEVIDGYTGDQRFFIGWSQVWRSKSREQTALQRLTTDPHSPSEFRANGAAVNSDAFHEAFGTKSGDQMFKPSSERIRLW
ncbi:M13 family metallopeptidase [Paucibacter sp. APW11]|uniref:M13 family metallopeptidase n=1 Tax=Roseateles aquae TaxID=3077235 RepID=A0ABU3PGY7_9BURK|nr:M13 family metallopeptidase [Paucibacter sp. APW11]MDT9001808.1 M13 family metallopeptidase [Paucibacter sp. APW11]